MPAARRLALFDDFASTTQLPCLPSGVEMIEFPVQHFLREFCLIIPLGGQLAAFACYLVVAQALLGWKWRA